VLTLGIFFASVPISSIVQEEQLQQQLQPEIQNQAELEALSQFLGSIGVVIGAIVLAVGIGWIFSGILRTIERKRMGMDCYDNFYRYSNSNSNYFCCIN